MIHNGIDFLGPHGGELALAFAAGCMATWVFIKILHDKQIVEIKALMASQKEACDRDRADSAISEQRLWDRIKQLETVLMTTGNASTRAQLQKMAEDAE